MINSKPGERKYRFTESFPPFYQDYRTCGTYLKQNRTAGDYVLAFASAQQAAVYSGTIDACYRPKLEEHRGPTHFRTGSLYLDSKEDFMSIAKSLQHNIWIIHSKIDIRPNTWMHTMIGYLEDYIVCQAPDNNTVLIKIPSTTLAQLLQ